MDFLLQLLNIEIFLVKFQFAINSGNVRVFRVRYVQLFWYCPLKRTKVALRHHIHTGLWLTIRRVNTDTEHFWPKCDNSHFLYFVQWNNKCTISWQIITLLLHVSTLLSHSQGVRSQYLAKLRKYINAVLVISLLLNPNV